MKRPLVVIAVGYIIGIVWGLYCSCSIALLYSLIIPILYVIKKTSKNKKQFKLFSFRRYFRYIKLFLKLDIIVTIIIFSIISNSIVIYQNNKYNKIYSNMKDVNIVGIVVSNSIEKDYKNMYKLKVESVNGSSKFKNTYVLLYVKKNAYNTIQYGDRIDVKGEFKEPNSQRNYKGFNYKNYLKTKKIYGIVNINTAKVLNKNSLNRAFILSNSVFLCIKKRFKDEFPEKYSNILNAIMLGDKEELDENINQNFRESNIAHVLAISGMHITYIIMGIKYFFNITLGKRKSIIICIIVLIIYMFITGFSPSVVRASIMGILIMLSKIINRKNDIWSSISFSILCILIYNPFLISNTGVMLSYGGVVGIQLFKKTINESFDKIKIKDVRYKYKIKKYEKQLNYVKETLSISISVQIMILPILVSSFNTFGLTFLITNLLLSIIIGPIIILGFIAIILSISITWSLKIIIYPLTVVLQLLILISKLGSKLPLNKIYIGTPKLYEIIFYYVVVFSINFIYKIYNKKEPRSFEYRIRNIISLIKYKLRINKNRFISCVILGSLLLSIIKIIPQKLQIHFIDVGQGDCSLIITPLRKTILIDGGGSETYDVGKNTLLPYLLDRGITKVDYLMISHMDQDHVRTDY